MPAPLLPHPRTTLLLLALLAALAAPAPAAAQGTSATLRILVRDVENGRPLPDAQVTLSGGSHRGTRTDKEGSARFAGLPEGKHWVKVDRLGYRAERVGVEVAQGTDMELEVTLPIDTLALSVVVATGQRRNAGLIRLGFYNRREVGVGTFLDERDLRPYRNYPDLMAVINRLPGFTVERIGGGGDWMVVSRRGQVSIARGCRPQLFLDGMLVTPSIISAVVPSQVAAIESYAGPATTPALFNQTGEGPPCGTIVVWTRTGP